MLFSNKINLTSFYRSTRLSEIIGQETNVRFLQNSLFKEILYPVYMFTGMRGTGKTSTARIFALSKLCENYSKFKNGDISVKLPCQKCISCEAFYEKRHPDIIELDAASNTGVDTIRSLIENASLSPIMCNEKFYIIDEVHMLSKAAFNACLKIMEEPPKNVHFILATTEPQKVIDTIKSRSIILNFKPIEKKILSNYLKEICNKESIEITDDAIDLLCDISEGSVRDALNYLERLRLSNSKIEKNRIELEFGKTDKNLIKDFIKSTLDKNFEEYQNFKKSFSSHYRCQRQFFTFLTSLLQEDIKEKMLKKIDIKNELVLLKLVYNYEESFLDSINFSGILDIFFYEFINFNDKNFSQNNTPNFEQKESNFKHKETFLNNNATSIKTPEVSTQDKKIDIFINKITEKEKPLGTVFRQGRLEINNEKNILNCSLKKSFIFYKDFINEKKNIWTSVLKEVFGESFNFEVIFEDSIINKTTEKENTNYNLQINQNISEKNNNNVNNSNSKEIEKNIKTESNNSTPIKNVSNYKNQGYQYRKKTVTKIKLDYEKAGEFGKKIMDNFPGITYYSESENN